MGRAYTLSEFAALPPEVQEKVPYWTVPVMRVSMSYQQEAHRIHADDAEAATEFIQSVLEQTSGNTSLSFPAGPPVAGRRERVERPRSDG
jgi:hypothetical protein